MGCISDAMARAIVSQWPTTLGEVTSRGTERHEDSKIRHTGSTRRDMGPPG